jgi:hypothetical protein
LQVTWGLKSCVTSKNLLQQETIVKTRLAFITGLLAVSWCMTAISQDYKPFPGVSADQRTLATQERVDELYQAGEYKRALFIYEKELAPRGDKYAQYMVGFMHLNGQSVPADKVTALAWYRLSAERGYGILEQARDDLARTMTPEEIEASNTILLELLQEIGDTMLIMKLIRRDMDILKRRTGTHIPTSNVASPMVTITPSGMPQDPDFYRNVRRRLDARLNYLKTSVVISDLASETEDDRLRRFEEEVKSELAALDVP